MSSIFRTALLVESGVNIASMFQMILNPEQPLSFLVKGPLQVTPATKSLMQWFGGIIALATAPLLLSYPEPGPGQPASAVTARRRLAYSMMGAGEAALALLTGYQYLNGDSGMTDQALLTATGMMATFLSMRVYFLYVKPELMEAKDSGKKA